MKTSTSIIASIVIAGSMIVGTASAITLDDVDHSGNVNLNIENGVATLFGHVDNSFERIQAENAAKELEGVDKVINILSFSN